MENKTELQLRTEKENSILKNWDISNLSEHMVKNITLRLEKEGRNVNNKGKMFKIVRW